MSQNDFNWPAAGRKDVMYLSSIRNNEPRVRAISQDYKYNTNIPKQTYYNKESFINKCDDIVYPKSNIRETRNSLDIGDIQGTKPQVVKFQTGRECNPLEPIYKVPSFQAAPLVYGPNFLKDPLRINDIPGTTSKSLVKQPRKTDPYTDIAGSHPRQPKQGRSIYTEKIESVERHQTRHLDPLQPIYKWMNGAILGDVEGSHSAIRHMNKNKEKSQSLQTRDINGAQANTVKPIPTNSSKQTNITSDVIGAQAGTLKRGIQTKRQIHPLNPAYQLPGCAEIYK